MEVLLAAVLAAGFVLMIMVFRRSAATTTRPARRGRKITWDRPENISIGEW